MSRDLETEGETLSYLISRLARDSHGVLTKKFPELKCSEVHEEAWKILQTNRT